MKLFKTKKEKKQKDKKQVIHEQIAKNDESAIMPEVKETPKVETPNVAKKEKQKVDSQKKSQFSSLYLFKAIELEDGSYSFQNLDTGEILNRKFSFASSRNSYSCREYSVVTQEVGEPWAVYFPETDTLLEARSGSPFGIFGDLEMCPTDFDLLPTRLFRDQEFIDRCLDCVADGLKELAEQNGSTKELETYTQEIVDLFSQKIEKEKANIAKEDERRLQENTPQQETNINKNINTIRNLGREGKNE